MAYGSMREIKLCLLGDAGVGKSCLVLRFVSDRFDLHTTATIGASFMSKTFNVGDKAFKYQIWDTAGQEKYKALAPMYYRGAAAAIVVYDLTNETTFQSVKLWVKELKQIGPPNIVIAIAGNKSDLKDQREVSLETGVEYAESINAVFAEVSALTSDNVNYLFEDISRRLPPEKPSYSPGGLKPLVKPSPRTNYKCC
ncbi:ras-related protein Rab-22A-like [Hydractinia symbiolongicarpus]|uniref:ras-related protein Rab-22A-like n=1 Tax=Hydractinia symbiolongicarpus TaxID=13093 RepID=UPI00254C7BA6|nr:ras-related protein Rab-22A-like [Hydractinia symbiolongicarpus]XP_057310345.1 ras-related protein Rab-22A-like [Hydractinia symbiolongicarpus]XP_057310346.1 ras-related protein Rab-22A-like [Hydractinia symbiolongicarpus]